MKIKLEDIIKETLKEMLGASMGARQSGGSFVGRNMYKGPDMQKADARPPPGAGGMPPEESHSEDITPEPRARLSDIVSYKKCYSNLMGRPRNALVKTINELLEEAHAEDSQSCAQAIADYLNDHEGAGSKIA